MLNSISIIVLKTLNISQSTEKDFCINDSQNKAGIADKYYIHKWYIQFNKDTPRHYYSLTNELLKGFFFIL